MKYFVIKLSGIHFIIHSKQKIMADPDKNFLIRLVFLFEDWQMSFLVLPFT